LSEPQTITTAGKNKQDLKFDQQIMADFEDQLKAFIGQIFDRKIPFSQTDDLDICKFCGYCGVCNR
jgi:hypothetical protein